MSKTNNHINFISFLINLHYKSHYIDYDSLKKIIRDLIQNQEIEKSKKEEGNNNMINVEINNYIEHTDEKLLIKDKLYSHMRNSNSIDLINEEVDPLERIFKTNKGKYAKKFLDSLEKEINKFFTFFQEIENKINVSLSKEIMKENMISESDNFFESLYSFLDGLGLILNDILDLCTFINLNVTAIRIILDRFDKAFDNLDLPVSYFFLQSKLKSANSSLVYIFQFKTIDEASAIIEHICERMKKKFNIRNNF